MLEYVQELIERSSQLRDYASMPGNAWLAKSELQAISQLTSELDALLEEIKQADRENGY